MAREPLSLAVLIATTPPQTHGMTVEAAPARKRSKLHQPLHYRTTATDLSATTTTTTTSTAVRTRPSAAEVRLWLESSDAAGGVLRLRAALPLPTAESCDAALAALLEMLCSAEEDALRVGSGIVGCAVV